jgi:hypothetical protein
LPLASSSSSPHDNHNHHIIASFGRRSSADSGSQLFLGCGMWKVSRWNCFVSASGLRVLRIWAIEEALVGSFPVL